VHNVILAAINPDNTPSGYQWTYLFPMLLFIVIAGILYLLFSRPHRRVPTRAITLGASASRPAAGAHGAHLVAGSAGTAPAEEASVGETAGEAEQSGEDTSE
jgi:hypothetical protein